MAFASTLAGEIFEFCRLGFLGMSRDARTFYVPGYGYDISLKKDCAIVRTPSSSGKGLKFPRGLRPGKYDELVKKDLCSPECEVSAVTLFGDPSKKWIPFEEGVIRINNRRSMTVFGSDGSVKHITIYVPTWGVPA
jgi:hypothetical protein